MASVARDPAESEQTRAGAILVLKERADLKQLDSLRESVLHNSDESVSDPVVIAVLADALVRVRHPQVVADMERIVLADDTRSVLGVRMLVKLLQQDKKQKEAIKSVLQRASTLKSTSVRREAALALKREWSIQERD
jgi:hypothetical protein